MKYRDISAGEYESARHWEGEAEQIKRRVSSVVGFLATLFNGNEVGGVGSLEFNKLEGPHVVAEIRTPAGSGRLRLIFEIARAELAAMVVVERELFDELGRVAHQPVWGFYVPSRGNGFVDPLTDKPHYVFDSGTGKALENSIFALGLSISYALVAGPLTAS